MLKPALCAAALVVAAAVAIPAIAQQSPQADNPSANSPAAQAGPDGRRSGLSRSLEPRSTRIVVRAGGAGKDGATAAMTITARAGMDRVSADATA